jgi:hypothetical protein
MSRMTAIKRIGHVWTTAGLFDVALDEGFPRFLVTDEGTFEATVDAQGTIQRYTGRHTQAEFVNYYRYLGPAPCAGEIHDAREGQRLEQQEGEHVRLAYDEAPPAEAAVDPVGEVAKRDPSTRDA